MIVKEILLNALANAGDIHDGESSESDELNLALRLFNTEMKFYSGRNLITAYQAVIDIDEAKGEQVIGKYNVRKGRRVYEMDSMPSAESYVKYRDYIRNTKNGRFYHIVELEYESGEVRKEWQPCGADEPCEYVPDVICNNMERVVSVMYKSSLNKYEKLRFVPLSQFYTEDDDYIYCTTAAGENKVKLVVPDYIKGRPLKIVYNTNMDFQKNDRLELPDNHIALVEVALTVAILRHDADSDPARLNNYLAQLKQIEDNIEATTVTERRIMRSNSGYDEDYLRSGRFILSRRRS